MEREQILRGGAARGGDISTGRRRGKDKIECGKEEADAGTNGGRPAYLSPWVPLQHCCFSAGHTAPSASAAQNVDKVSFAVGDVDGDRGGETGGGTGKI